MDVHFLCRRVEVCTVSELWWRNPTVVGAVAAEYCCAERGLLDLHHLAAVPHGPAAVCQRGAPAGEAGTPASVCVDCACQYAAQGAKASHHASVRSHVSQMASRLLCTLTTRHAGRSPEHSLIHTGTPLSSSTLTPTPLCVSAG